MPLQASPAGLHGCLAPSLFALESCSLRLLTFCALRFQKCLKKKVCLHVAQSPIVEAQPYLPHVTPRVPRSFHAKFHADWTKTVGARGTQTNKQTILFLSHKINFVNLCFRPFLSKI